jgi:hypothetical protein
MRREETHTGNKTHYVRMKTEMVLNHKPRNSWSHWKLEDAKKELP